MLPKIPPVRDLRALCGFRFWAPRRVHIPPQHHCLLHKSGVCFCALNMPKRRITPKYIADHIRRVLKDGGSAPHSEEVQWFFKEEVQSRGWYTAELRKVAVRFRRSMVREQGMDFLIQVADKLFSGKILEEKVFAVFLLDKQTKHFG